MENDKLERVLRTVNPAKRVFLKKLVIGTAFAVPIIASYSVKDLAYASVGSCPVTSTTFVTTTLHLSTTVTVTTITCD